MKALIVIIILFCVIPTSAQNLNDPGKEFSITLSAGKIETKTTDVQKMELFITKSRSYKKGKIKTFVSSTLPEGITITLSPKDEDADEYTVTITTNDAPPGEYSLILGAIINYKQKGSMLKLIVQWKSSRLHL